MRDRILKLSKKEAYILWRAATCDQSVSHTLRRNLYRLISKEEFWELKKRFP